MASPHCICSRRVHADRRAAVDACPRAIDQTSGLSKSRGDKRSSFSLDPAAIAAIKVVDAVSGKAVDGAAISRKKRGRTYRQRLQSQTVYVDNPVTDASGNVREFVPAGRRRFFAECGAEPGSRPTRANGRSLLRARKRP